MSHDRHRASLRTALLSLAAVAAAVTGCTRPVTDHLVTGRPFPDITLTALDGSTRPLADYRGRLVVLNVWATWCGPCRRELPSLQRLSKTLDPAQYAVIAMSVDDDATQVREYLLDSGISLPAFIDRGRRIANGVFGVHGFPDTFIIGPGGHLLGQIAGDRRWDAPAVTAALEAARRGDHFDI